MLRDHYGTGYVSVAIGFHHGDLGVATVPDPAPDWLDARLGTSDRPARWLDLRAGDLRRRWDGPAKARVISGVYDPARDAAEHLAVAPLPAALDTTLSTCGRYHPYIGYPDGLGAGSGRASAYMPRSRRLAAGLLHR